MDTREYCAGEADLKDRGELVQTLWDAIDHGVPRLQTIPALVKKILQTEAWRCRIHKGKKFEHGSFLEFLTAKPLAGCGYDPEQIEALIEDDPETLVMWRRAVVAPERSRSDLHDNVRQTKPQQGNSRAYVLDRLAREAPELYEAVKRDELSPYAAAIEAGFRRRPEPFEQIKRLLPKLSTEQRLALKQML